MLMGGGGLMRVGLSCEWRVKVDVHGGGGLMWVGLSCEWRVRVDVRGR